MHGVVVVVAGAGSCCGGMVLVVVGSGMLVVRLAAVGCLAMLANEVLTVLA